LDDGDTREVGVGENLEAVVFTAGVLRKTAVDAEDLLVDFGSDGEILEDLVDGNPDFHTLFATEALQALVLEGAEGVDVNITVDFGRLVVASEQVDAVGGDGLEGEEVHDALDTVVATIDVVSEEEEVGGGVSHHDILEGDDVLQEEEHVSEVTVDITEDANWGGEVEVEIFLGEDVSGRGADGENQASELGKVVVAELSEVGVTAATEDVDDAERIGSALSGRAHTVGFDVSEGDHGRVGSDGLIEGARLGGAVVSGLEGRLARSVGLRNTLLTDGVGEEIEESGASGKFAVFAQQENVLREDDLLRRSVGSGGSVIRRSSLVLLLGEEGGFLEEDGVDDAKAFFNLMGNFDDVGDRFRGEFGRPGVEFNFGDVGVGEAIVVGVVLTSALLIGCQEIKLDAPVRLQRLDATNLVSGLTILRIFNTATNEETGDEREEFSANLGVPVRQTFARHAAATNNIQRKGACGSDTESRAC
jgi:hypothetical protein